jgi:hypothetical protein
MLHTNSHEICYRALAIADKLMENSGDERRRLEQVEPGASGQPFLCQATRTVELELFDLPGHKSHGWQCAPSVEMT